MSSSQGCTKQKRSILGCSKLKSPETICIFDLIYTRDLLWMSIFSDTSCLLKQNQERTKVYSRQKCRKNHYRYWKEGINNKSICKSQQRTEQCVLKGKLPSHTLCKDSLESPVIHGRYQGHTIVVKYAWLRGNWSNHRMPIYIRDLDTSKCMIKY